MDATSFIYECYESSICVKLATTVGFKLRGWESKSLSFITGSAT